MIKAVRLSLLPILALLVSACGLSLAEDIRPPDNYRAPIVQTQAPVSGSTYPLAAANLESGRDTYLDKCAPCHGDLGRGDGPQAADLPNPVAPLGLPEVARQASPERWYQIVSEGNLDRFMPPFRSLTVNQRWDVIAYAYSLSAPASLLEEGAALYTENCAACHGPQGGGDGTAAGAARVALARPQFLAQQSSTDLFAVITHGQGEMPAFEAELDESQRWAVSDYVRSWTFTAPALPQAQQPGSAVPTTAASDTTSAAGTTPGETDTTPPASLEGRVYGQVVNGSGGELDPGMIVTLHGFDRMDMAFTITTTVETDGAYEFSEIEMPSGRLFLATTEFQGATYTSDILVAEQQGGELELPIAVYPTTSDASVLSIDRLHLFFEFLDEDTLRVIELFVVSNLSQQTLVAPAPGEPVVTFTLPEGATNLEFQEGSLGDRYIATADGFGDTMPIRPGMSTYQVLLAFELPFSRKLEIVQPMQINTNAVVILVPDGIIQVEGANLVDAGARPIDDQVFRTFNGSSVRAGESLRLTISGSTGWAAGPLLNLGDSSSLLIGLSAFGLALVGAGAFLYLRSRSQVDEDEDEEDEDVEAPDDLSDDPELLMDAILALDDQYQSGELPDEAYRQRRAELKERLRQLTS
jgi:mono/diheme cytochrome c family protein